MVEHYCRYNCIGHCLFKLFSCQIEFEYLVEKEFFLEILNTVWINNFDWKIIEICVLSAGNKNDPAFINVIVMCLEEGKKKKKNESILRFVKVCSCVTLWVFSIAIYMYWQCFRLCLQPDLKLHFLYNHVYVVWKEVLKYMPFPKVLAPKSCQWLMLDLKV